MAGKACLLRGPRGQGPGPELIINGSPYSWLPGVVWTRTQYTSTIPLPPCMCMGGWGGASVLLKDTGFLKHPRLRTGLWRGAGAPWQKPFTPHRSLPEASHLRPWLGEDPTKARGRREARFTEIGVGARCRAESRGSAPWVLLTRVWVVHVLELPVGLFACADPAGREGLSTPGRR